MVFRTQIREASGPRLRDCMLAIRFMSTDCCPYHLVVLLFCNDNKRRNTLLAGFCKGDGNIMSI